MRTIIFAFCCLFSANALAELKIEDADRVKTSFSVEDGDTIGIILSYHVNRFDLVGVKFYWLNANTEPVNYNSAREETFYKIRREFGRFGPYLRTAIGENLFGKNHYPYYSITPGLQINLTGRTDLDVSVKHKDSFSSSDKAGTNSAKIGLDYKPAKDIKTGLSLERVIGDRRETNVELEFIVSF